MADRVSPEKRSEIMSRIRDRDSKIEVRFRKALWKLGYRYRKNVSKYFGKPDVVLKSRKIVIFVDSCFWHGCQAHCRMPTSRKQYWKKKIDRNKMRDKEVTKYYEYTGWKMYRIWEHDIDANFQLIVSRWKARKTNEERKHGSN